MRTDIIHPAEGASRSRGERSRSNLRQRTVGENERHALILSPDPNLPLLPSAPRRRDHVSPPPLWHVTLVDSSGAGIPSASQHDVNLVVRPGTRSDRLNDSCSAPEGAVSTSARWAEEDSVSPGKGCCDQRQIIGRRRSRRHAYGGESLMTCFKVYPSSQNPGTIIHVKGRASVTHLLPAISFSKSHHITRLTPISIPSRPCSQCQPFLPPSHARIMDIEGGVDLGRVE